MHGVCGLIRNEGHWVGRFCNACEVLPAGGFVNGWFDLCWR